MVAAPCAPSHCVRGPVRKHSAGRPFNGIVSRHMAQGIVMRLVVAAFLGAASFAHGGVMKDVDLDAPGVLDTLKSENPDHYRRISAVYEAARRMSCYSPEFRELVREKFGATNAACGGLTMNSGYRAKGVLSFELGTTRYSTDVTIVPDEKLQRPRNAD
jgi:hypothetical protein